MPSRETVDSKYSGLVPWEQMSGIAYVTNNAILSKYTVTARYIL